MLAETGNEVKSVREMALAAMREEDARERDYREMLKRDRAETLVSIPQWFD